MLTQIFDEYNKRYPESPDTINAGIIIRTKAGGPEMLLAGFTFKAPESFNYQFFGGNIVYINTSQNAISIVVYPKIAFNRERRTVDFYQSNSKNEVPDYFCFLRQSAEMPDFAYHGNRMFLVCKYWSESLKEFKHEILNINEVWFP